MNPEVRMPMKKNGVVQSNNSITLTDGMDLSPGTKVEVQIRVIKPRSKIDRSVFGIWRNRKDIGESREWVSLLREKEWRRS
jgi:hypothetical protein